MAPIIHSGPSITQIRPRRASGSADETGRSSAEVLEAAEALYREAENFLRAVRAT